MDDREMFKNMSDAEISECFHRIVFGHCEEKSNLENISLQEMLCYVKCKGYICQSEGESVSIKELLDMIYRQGRKDAIDEFIRRAECIFKDNSIYMRIMEEIVEQMKGETE